MRPSTHAVFSHVLRAPTNVSHCTIRDLLFADDCALNATSHEKMQKCMNKFTEACDNFDLTISTKKTEVMYQPAPGVAYIEPNIEVKGTKLQAADRFTYLGSTLSRCVHINDEVNSSLAKASAAFGRLRPTVWERSGISLATKLNKAVVITTLLYACETWTVYRRHARKLQQCHTTSLRRILNIRWQDKVPDTEVLERANLPSIYTLLKKCQLRWAGHVYRMPDHRIPKQLLYGELASGKRSVGGQRKRFKDSLKTSLKAMNIDWESWESHALDRPPLAPSCQHRFENI